MNWRKLLPVILVAAGLIAYHNSFSGPFVFDDLTAIQNNDHIRHLWPLRQIFTAPSQTSAAGRPIVCLTLALNYALGGSNVWGYHAVNLAIHIAAALVLFGLVRRTLMTAPLRARYGDVASGLAMATSLIWMIHPLQTSSVTYVIQRAESLMGLFYLLTLYCVIRGADSPCPAGCYGGAVLVCALGMGTKENMVTAPLMVLLYDRIFLAGSLREAWQKRWPLYAGLALSWIGLGALVMSGVRTESVGLGFENISVADYARTQCDVVIHYLQLAFWPRPLVLDYYWPVARSLRDIASSVLLLVGLIGVTAWALVRHPKLGFLGAWFFVILAPSSSILPIITEIAAEHRMYLPLAAVVMLSIVAAYQCLGQVKGLALLVVVAAILGGLTIERNRDYRSEVSIWTDTLAKRPDNPRAWNNLGTIFAGQGNYGESIYYFRQAILLEPHFAYAHYNLAKALQAQKQFDEAVDHYQEALRVRPGMTNVRMDLGMLLGDLGRIDEAVEQFSEVLRFDPLSANAQYNLGAALAREGKLADAVPHFEEAVRLEPSFTVAREALNDARRRLAK